MRSCLKTALLGLILFVANAAFASLPARLGEPSTLVSYRPLIVQVERFAVVAFHVRITAYGFDELYRQTNETRSTTGQTAYSVQSFYDLRGNRTKCVYQDGRTLISRYDPRNLLVEVADSNAVSAYAYDLNGNQLSVTTPNGVLTTNAFDALNRVLIRSAANATGNVYTVAYQYDLVGNRRTIVEDIAQQGVRNSSYGYDSQYRLLYETNVLGGATNSAVYSFDLAGNRLTLIQTVTGQVAQIDYSYNDLNELLSTSNGGSNTTYSYDLNGSRLAKNSGVTTQQFCYDTLNRLISVTNAGVNVFSATYDYRARRLTKTEGGNATYFRYDGGDSFQEYTNGTMSVEFVRGSGLGGGIGSILYSDRSVSGGEKEFFTYSAVGHTVALTLTNGAVQKTDLYEAFGNIASSTGSSLNNRLANTKERDASLGLDNHGIRYYDPETGRYLTRDPVGYGDGLNVYIYVHCNPINHIDPLGLKDDNKIPDIAQSAPDAAEPPPAEEPSPKANNPEGQKHETSISQRNYPPPSEEENVLRAPGGENERKLALNTFSLGQYDVSTRIGQMQAEMTGETIVLGHPFVGGSVAIGLGANDFQAGNYGAGTLKIGLGVAAIAGTYLPAAKSPITNPSRLLPPASGPNPWAGDIVSEVTTKPLGVERFAGNPRSPWVQIEGAGGTPSTLSVSPGNAANRISSSVIPAGTRIQSGTAAAVPEWGGVGGARQIEILDNSVWQNQMLWEVRPR